MNLSIGCQRAWKQDLWNWHFLDIFMKKTSHKLNQKTEKQPHFAATESGLRMILIPCNTREATLLFLYACSWYVGTSKTRKHLHELKSLHEILCQCSCAWSTQPAFHSVSWQAAADTVPWRLHWFRGINLKRFCPITNPFDFSRPYRMNPFLFFIKAVNSGITLLPLLIHLNRHVHLK